MSVPGTNNDSLVRCTVCGSEEWVNFQACLQLGWPKCHGYTMRLETHPSLDAIGEATAAVVGAPKKTSGERNG